MKTPRLSRSGLHRLFLLMSHIRVTSALKERRAELRKKLAEYAWKEVTLPHFKFHVQYFENQPRSLFILDG